MDEGTDTAETLDNQTGITGVASFQDRFNATPKSDTAPGILNYVFIINFHFNS
jgi:hypothetical protein